MAKRSEQDKVKSLSFSSASAVTNDSFGLISKRSSFSVQCFHNDIPLEKCLIDFVKEGIEKMQENAESSPKLAMRDSAILIVGSTGGGKSTLINYLNNVSLKCILESNKYRLDLADNAQALPGGFKIGHSTTKSETLYPGIYSPPSQDYSYVDCPGFGDSRGAGIDIANAFFRNEVTKDAKQLKILLVVSYSTLTDTANRGEGFVNSLRDLSKFFTVFDRQDDKSKELLKQSICVIVTQVSNPLGEKVEAFRKQINDYNENIIEARKKIEKFTKTKDIEEVKEWEEKLGKYSTEQKHCREKLVELSPSNKSDKDLLQDALKSFLSGKEQDLGPVAKDILNHIITTDKFESFSNPSDSDIGNIGTEERDRILKLIHEDIKYISKDLAAPRVVVSEQHVGALVKYIHSKTEMLVSDMSRNLKNAIKQLLEDAVTKAISMSEIKELTNKLDQISDNGKKVKELIDFINDLKDLGVLTNDFAQYSQTAGIIGNFIAILPDTYKKEFNNAKEWGKEFGLEGNIAQWQHGLRRIIEPSNFALENNELVCKGFFVSTSELNKRLGEDEAIVPGSLKRIKIYAAGKVNIDQDVVSEKVNGVSIAVIAPKWHILKPTQINISGLAQRTYPDGKEKAENGKEYGEKGHDGKPGLPGCNGGDFYGQGKEFDGIEKLTLISNGGRGGAGQAGGDGAEGKKGADTNFGTVKRDDAFRVGRVDPFGNEYFQGKGGIGGNGGDAGKNGIGGYGGLAGKITLKLIGDSEVVEPCDSLLTTQLFEMKDGEQGINGSGAKGGLGGLSGDSLVKIFFNGKSPAYTKVVNPLKNPSSIDYGWKDFYMLPAQERLGSPGQVTDELNESGRIRPQPNDINHDYSDYDQLCNSYELLLSGVDCGDSSII